MIKNIISMQILNHCSIWTYNLPLHEAAAAAAVEALLLMKILPWLAL